MTVTTTTTTTTIPKTTIEKIHSESEKKVSWPKSRAKIKTYSRKADIINKILYANQNKNPENKNVFNEHGRYR